MLYGMIFDATEELANDNALYMKMEDFDILHRVSQVVQEHLSALDKYGRVAIESYRYHERKKWEAHNVACELESLLTR